MITECKKKMLVAFEFSGIVRTAFEKLGWDAWSVDLLPTEIPGQHYQTDAFDILGTYWDLIIAHPPCTYLAVSGNRYHANTQRRIDAIKFVEMIWCITKDKPLCIENPVGVLHTQSLIFNKIKPQYIQPHEFGEDASKKTSLFLRDLPRLKIDPAKYIQPRIVNGKKRWANQTDSGQNKLAPSETRASDRSRTYQGIADAMAIQWTEYLK